MSATPRRSPNPEEPAVPRLSLTVLEAASSLGITLEYFQRHVLPAVETVAVGDRQLIPTSELQRWLRSDATEAVLTLAEVAEHMRVSERTVLRAIRAGELAASQLNRRGGWRIYQSAMRDWMTRRATTPRTNTSAPAPRRIDPVPRRRGPTMKDSTGRLTP